MQLDHNKHKLIMGFDYGTKYIGIAIGQTTTNSARPLECLTIKNKQINWLAIDNLIKTWNPTILVVGIPLTIQSKPQNITIECLNFAKKLQHKFNLPTFQVDETLSTWEAKQDLAIEYKSQLSRINIKKVNSYAAMILVTQWLNENKFFL